MENIMDKTDLEEKYEIAINKMYSTLHKIIKILEEEKETHENNLSIRDYESLYTSTTSLKEEVDATMGAIYEVLPLYKGEMVVEKQTMELESKYFSFIKRLTKKIPEWGLM
jgi:hypothetical protein